jgi:putative addiction module killer protein
VPQIEILIYREGKSAPFTKWLSSLRDLRAISVVRARLNRIRLGNFGDCKSVGGGVYELRIDFGPGYRVYFGRDGPLVVVLLRGGSKRGQAKDIFKAQIHWRNYLSAKKDG